MPMLRDAKLHATAHGPVLGYETDLRDVGEWKATVVQVREAILKGYVVGSHMLEAALPPAVMQLAPSQDDVERIAETCDEAIRAGRMIDFGHWTNDVIKYAAHRAGPLYSRGVLGHPFSQPYMFMHTWEYASSIYMVNPLEPDRLAGGDCEAVELQPLHAGGENVLMIADRMLLTPHDGDDWSKYHCSAIPSLWRYLPGADAAGMNNGLSQPQAAAGNVLDPLMTALLILSTRGIERETVHVSEKLQKARLKNGKSAIPPYLRVASKPYVTAIQARQARGRKTDLGGSHASPIGHLRMGHIRTYASGVQVFVRDALVNMTDEARKAWMGNRSHYVVK